MSSSLAWTVVASALLPNTAAAQCPALPPSAPITGEPAALVAERRPLSGLASLYNGVTYYRLDAGNWRQLGARDPLDKACLLAAVGRHKTLLVDLSSVDRSAVSVEANGSFRLKSSASGQIVGNEDLSGNIFRPLRYPHLWWPLHPIARAMEGMLVLFHGIAGASWGVAILLLALALRLLLFPVTRYTSRAQRHVAAHEARLAPRIAAIRGELRGEEAHMATLAAYKELGISPYFRMRPLLGALIQVPLLIAVFNVLGAMPQLVGAQFLWIADLSMPDTIGKLPFALPMLGQEISLLPLLMTACAIIAGRTYCPSGASETSVRGQRRNVYLLAALFLLLFYPFPAAMVWFWFSANLLQLGQQWIGQARNG